MESYLDYINKKLNEDKVVLPIISKKQIVNEEQNTQKETIQKVIKKSRSDLSIAKDILEDVSEEIKPYFSNLLIKEDGLNITNDNFQEDMTENIIINKRITNDIKHAAMLLPLED